MKRIAVNISTLTIKNLVGEVRDYSGTAYKLLASSAGEQMLA